MFMIVNSALGIYKHVNNNKMEPTPTTKRVTKYGSMSDCHSMKGSNYNNPNCLITEAIRNSPPLKQKFAPRSLFEAEVTAIKRPHFSVIPSDKRSGKDNDAGDNKVEDDNHDVCINTTGNTGTEKNRTNNSCSCFNANNTHNVDYNPSHNNDSELIGHIDVASDSYNSSYNIYIADNTGSTNIDNSIHNHGNEHYHTTEFNSYCKQNNPLLDGTKTIDPDYEGFYNRDYRV